MLERTVKNIINPTAERVGGRVKSSMSPTESCSRVKSSMSPTSPTDNDQMIGDFSARNVAKLGTKEVLI